MADSAEAAFAICAIFGQSGGQRSQESADARARAPLRITSMIAANNPSRLEAWLKHCGKRDAAAR